MKKKVAGAMLLLMLGVGAVSSTAYATTPLYSPEGVTITPPPVTPNIPYNPPKSPKTADINIFAIEAVGLASAGIAVATKRRRS